jgi:enamine deaminase RidA (YjgF/YER057c/UK114 family)
MELLFDGCLTSMEVTRAEHFSYKFLFRNKSNFEKQRLISAERNAMWQSDCKPASTLISVLRLAVDGVLFEIDAIAAILNS